MLPHLFYARLLVKDLKWATASPRNFHLLRDQRSLQRKTEPEGLIMEKDVE